MTRNLSNELRACGLMLCEKFPKQIDNIEKTDQKGRNEERVHFAI